MGIETVLGRLADAMELVATQLAAMTAVEHTGAVAAVEHTGAVTAVEHTGAVAAVEHTGAVTEAPAEEVVEEKPARKRRTKAEMEADARADARAAEVADDLSDATEQQKRTTAYDLAVQLSECQPPGSLAEVRKITAAYAPGVVAPKLANIPADQLDAAIAALSKAIKAHAVTKAALAAVDEI